MTLYKPFSPSSNAKGHRGGRKLEQAVRTAGQERTDAPRRNANSFWKDAFTKKRSGPCGKYFNKIEVLFYYEQQISKTQNSLNNNAL